MDRHIHIRRVANMNMAVVYEWDHASKSLLYKNSITKSPWRYDKSVFKLYKSAELHTKQKRKLPGLVWFIAAGLAGVVYFAPNLQARINDRIHGQSVSKSQENMPNDGKKQYIENGMLVSVETTTSKTIAPSGPTAPASSPVAVSVAAPVARGCVMVADRCGCQDVTGQVVKADVSECRVVLASDRPVADVSGLQDYPPRAPLPKTTIDLSF